MQHTGTDALLERQHELEELDGLLEGARAGRGRLVLVEGPAGIGKTRLLQSAADRARGGEVVVLSARASELDRDFPFGLVRQLFDPLLGAAGETRRAVLLRGAAGRAAGLLGHDGSDATPASDGTDPSWAHFHALYWLVANLAEHAPAVLLLDDLHWADSGSLRFLQFLLPRLTELAVLVVAATRPPGGEAAATTAARTIDAVAADPATVVLRPAPLSDGAVAALVGDELGHADPEFCDACREATGGNPFLLRELLRELAADDVAPAAAGAPLVRRLAPATVARAVVLRLVRLGDEAAALARAVAVLGDGTPLRRAAALACLPAARAEELASALTRADILAAQRPLAYAHPILRAAVYSDIDPGERSRAHRDAATVLADDGEGADAIAVHLLATEPAADRDAIVTLREAARRALARGAAATAGARPRRALAESPAPADRGPIALELAQAELSVGDPAAAVEHFEAGLRTADVRTRVRCVSAQVLALQAVGRH